VPIEARFVLRSEEDRPPMTDVAVVGHFSIDSILLPNRSNSTVALGGAVTYVSLVARRLGATASVISRVGGDFPHVYIEWLKQEGIDLSGVVRIDAEQTTRFELQYCDSFSERVLRLKSRASSLSPIDVPVSFSAKVIHLAPIAGEVSFELAELLRSRAEILSLDAQGILRSVDSAGNISLSSTADRRILESANILKCSLNEIQILTGKFDLQSSIKAIHNLGITTVIVTMDARGAVLSVEGAFYEVPPFNSRTVVDPTGAGDVFVGGFLTELVRGRDPFWCACVGSGAASIVVEGIGPSCLGEKEEIYRRAQAIFGK